MLDFISIFYYDYLIMIHKINVYPNITKETEKFDFNDPQVDPIELAKDLAETMISNDGLGISATQIDLPLKVIAINSSSVIVCFNPIIVDQSEETVILEETCLSFPKLVAKIKRPKKIKVRYTQPNGEVVTQVYDGLTARIFQHQLSLIEGRNMISDCSYIEKERVIKKWKKLQK